jgi:hypothetical protein
MKLGSGVAFTEELGPDPVMEFEAGVFSMVKDNLQGTARLERARIF